MLIIKREMTVSETGKLHNPLLVQCQASFNSDGALTLRNYDGYNKNTDEIIILSHGETQAVINLFSRLGEIFRTNKMPFQGG